MRHDPHDRRLMIEHTQLFVRRSDVVSAREALESGSRSRHINVIMKTFEPVWRCLSLAALVVAMACATAPMPPATSVVSSVNTPTLPLASDAAADSLLVDVRGAAPEIRVQLRYATNDNFTGAPLPGYDANRALLRREAASALTRVAHAAAAEGFSLIVYDAYRPVRATRAMVQWARRTRREDLFRDGYIASRSRHNLGLAIDLTLADLRTGVPLDMGTPFDTFSREAHTANATGDILARRFQLTRVMESQGFVNYTQEWWHFSYTVANEVPFDRVIR